MLYLRLNSASDEELYAIPDTNKDIINKLIKYRGRHIVISELISEIKNKSFTYAAISRAVFKLLLSPAYTRAYASTIYNTKVPYIRVLGFRSSSSEFLKSLRYSETCSIITKPADGDMDDPSYLLDIYAANLYAQICANKYKTGFTDELKTGPVIVS
jgi:predicted nucleotidyltransferase